MPDFSFTLAEQILTITGEIYDPDAAAFRDALAEAGPPRLDMLDLDLEDGVSVAETVNALRILLARHGTLTIHHAPQMLAHTLYKIGMLEDGRLVLVQPRVEHPTVA